MTDNVRNRCTLPSRLNELRSHTASDRVSSAAVPGSRSEVTVAAPAGFTETEWKALGQHTCPRTNPACKCRVHYGQDTDPYLTSLRIIPTPPEPVINRRPAPQPWQPRAPRHLKRAA